jgi:glycosyltransferase involved in cell wall biosynthesis
VRIALFSETFVPQRNGVALVLWRLVRYLSHNGHQVLVATADPGTPLEEPELPPNVRLVKVPGWKLPRYPDLTMARLFSPRVAREVVAFRPDVVHLVTEYSMGLTGLTLARRMGWPRLASFHTNIPSYLPYYGFGWASRWCWAYLRWFHNRVGLTLCPSETSRRELLARGFRNVRVWGRGVDTSFFRPRWDSGRPEVSSAGSQGTPIRLLYVGRLTPEKEIPVLFRAYERARQLDPGLSLELILAGDGAYSPRMRSGAPPGVKFTGYLEGEALSQAYARADVFVFPSRTETLGNVVLEAMASGLPVVAAAEGGTLENVRHGVNGLLVPGGDADRFAEAIVTLARDGALRLRLARNARSWAEERSWDWAFEGLMREYRERIENSARGVQGQPPASSIHQ